MEYKQHLKTLDKSYKKSSKAWELFSGKVAKMIMSHGEAMTIEQINSAIEGNWKTIYEPKPDASRVRGVATGVFAERKSEWDM
jgi:hypothetical protein